MRERGRLLAALAVVVLALVLRWPSIGRDMPFFYHEDEAHHFNRIVDMVKEGRLDPQYFHKPSLHFYLRMPAIFAAARYAQYRGEIKDIQEIRSHDRFGLGDYAFTASHPVVVKAARVVSWALSVGTVVLTMILAGLCGLGPWGAVIAGAIIAVSPDLVAAAGFIGVDVVMMFFGLAASLAAVVALHRKTWLALAVASIVAGLAVSSKYNAAPVVLAPLLAGYFAFGARHMFRTILVVGVGSLCGFLGTSPYILFNIGLFGKQLGYEIWHYGTAGHVGHEGTPGVSQAWFYLRWLWGGGLGMGATIASILGLALALRERRREWLVVLVFPLAFFVLMCAQKVNFTRNMHVCLPFFALVAAYVFPFIRNGAVCAVAGALLIASPLYLSIRFLRTSEPESRREVAAVLRPIAVDKELLVAGELQLEPSLYRDLRATRTAQQQLNLPDAWLKGFDVVVSFGRVDPLPPGVSEVQVIRGNTFPQRVVRNPEIALYRVGEPPEIVARDTIRCGLLATCETSAGANFNEPRHAWVRERVTNLEIAASPGIGALEVMSPWPAQQVTVVWGDTKAGASQTLQLHQGEWHTILIPREASRHGRIVISKVSSPFTRGLSSDRRRLGLAVRLPK